MLEDRDPKETVREYVIEIDGVDYRWNQRAVTVADLRALAGLEADLLILLIDHDNSERLLTEEEFIWRPGTFRFRPLHPRAQASEGLP